MSVVCAEVGLRREDDLMSQWDNFSVEPLLRDTLTPG